MVMKHLMQLLNLFMLVYTKTNTVIGRAENIHGFLLTL